MFWAGYRAGFIILVVLSMVLMTLVMHGGWSFTLYAKKGSRYFRASPTHTALFFLFFAAIWPLGLPVLLLMILFPKKPAPNP